MDLKIGPTGSGGLILNYKNGTALITGSTRTSNPNKILEPFFNKIHEGVLKLELKSVIVDIRNLAFLNSSGIKEVVNWILKLEKLPDNKRYIIKFVYNPDIKWQETFVSSMINLNSNYVAKSCSI